MIKAAAKQVHFADDIAQLWQRPIAGPGRSGCIPPPSSELMKKAHQFKWLRFKLIYLYQRIVLGLVGFSSPNASADKGYQEKYDKNKEQNLRNRGSTCGNAKKAKSPGNKGNDQENDCPA